MSLLFKEKSMDVDIGKIMSLVKASAQLGAAEINNIHLPDSDSL